MFGLKKRKKKKEGTLKPVRSERAVHKSAEKLSLDEQSQAVQLDCHYIRTTSCRFQWKNADCVEYFDAIRKQGEDTWNVRRITMQERIKISPVHDGFGYTDADSVTELTSRIKTECASVCAMEALFRLYEYENARPQIYQAVDMSVIEGSEEEKAQHYRKVAHEAEIIFDRSGRPHVTQDGQPLDDADYADEELEALATIRRKSYATQQRVQNIKTQPIPIEPVALSDLFSEKGRADDIIDLSVQVKLENHLLKAIERLSWGCGWFYKGRSMQEFFASEENRQSLLAEDVRDWNGADLDRPKAYINFRGNINSFITQIVLASKLAANDDLSSHLAHITLYARALMASWSFQANRHIHYPGGDSDEDTKYKQEFDNWLDDGVLAVELMIEDMELDADQAAKIRAFIVQDRSLLEILQAFRNLQDKVYDIVQKLKANTDLQVGHMTQTIIDRTEMGDGPQALLPKAAPQTIK